MHLATNADEISDIAFAYMGSKALFCALDLEIFTALSQEPRDAEELAKTAEVRPDVMTTLLTALAGLGLVTQKDGKWKNAPASEAFLVKGAKYDFGDYLRLQVGRQMYGLIDQLDGVVGGEMAPGSTKSYADWFSNPAEARLYSESQHAGSLGPARQLARSLDLSGARTLLDVGGGTGAFAITLCKAFPELTATIVEFPNVAALGREYVTEAGLSDRIRYVEGDGREDIWPRGQDVLLMSYLFSGVPGEAHEPLMRRAYEHLAPGGHYLIHDFIVDADRSGPKLAALWQLQHTAFTPEARSLDTDSLQETLKATGFQKVRIETMIPEMTMLAKGRKPSA